MRHCAAVFIGRGSHVVKFFQVIQYPRGGGELSQSQRTPPRSVLR
ncbi:unnamed protein product [Periconia digitata]|uniref:Uncharacterized protein n=1 Tax=Periconia digitata TaxID=1303443 RepID=A0A9W4U7U2_9PLEO|nr:unnamed protein product [Periconia digitata]